MHNINSVGRRITNEIDEHLCKLNKPIKVEHDFQKPSLSITIDNKRFLLDENYPFSKPVVFINDQPYKRYLTPPTKRIYKLLNELNYKCICCNSILKDWTPMYRIVKLLDEIENFNCVKRIIKYRIAVEELGKKYQIISQIPNYILEYL